MRARIFKPMAFTAALIASGFLFFPENPSIVAFYVAAVTIPIALLGMVALPIIERRQLAQARKADVDFYYHPDQCE